MTKGLTEPEVNKFQEDGFLFPYEVYTPEEARNLWKKFNSLEKELGEEPQNRFRIKVKFNDNDLFLENPFNKN